MQFYPHRSIYSEISLDSIYSLLPKDQFSHLDFLVKTQKLGDDEWVIFLDDDDLIVARLPVGPEINGFVGYQYIGQYKEDVTVQTVDLLLEEYGDQMIFQARI